MFLPRVLHVPTNINPTVFRSSLSLSRLPPSSQSPSASPPLSLFFSFFLLLKKKERKNTKMLEEAIPSIWALVRGWLTPTVLFVLINLVIGTIVVTSKGIRRNAVDGGGDPSKLSRSPSLVLDRLRSFNLYRYRSGDIPLESSPQSEPLETPDASPDPAVSEAVEAIHAPEADPAVSEAAEAIHAPEADPAGKEHHQFSHSKSDTRPKVEEVPVKPAAKMKKSASDKLIFAHIDAKEAKEAEVVPRPATARPITGRREAKAEEEDNEEGEVDARADDFINRFRQQLQLQRLDSIIRYKEMLSRGSGNRS